MVRCDSSLEICLHLLNKDILQYKQYGQDKHRGGDPLELTACHVDGHIEYHTREDTVGNGVGQGHHDDADEGGDGLGEVDEINLGDGLDHEQAHKDEHGSRSGRGNGEEQRREEQGDRKAAGYHQCGEARATALSHASSALHIGRRGRGAEHRAYGGGNGIGQEGLLQARDAARLLVHHISLGAYANERTHRVEKVDEEEGEHHHEHVERPDVFPLKLAEDGGDRLGRRDEALELGDAHRDTDKRGGEDTDKHGATHIPYIEHARDDEADDGQQGRALGNLAQHHEGGIAIDDDACILHTDEGDEQADTCTDGIAQAARDGIDDGLTDVGDGHDDKQDTLDEDSRERKLPRVAHAHAYGEHEEGVESHTRSQAEGELTDEGHSQCAHDSGQGRSGEHGTCGHAVEQAEHRGVHGKDVRHGEEGGDTSQNLGAYGSCLRVETEKFCQFIHIYLLEAMSFEL